MSFREHPLLVTVLTAALVSLALSSMIFVVAGLDAGAESEAREARPAALSGEESSELAARLERLERLLDERDRFEIGAARDVQRVAATKVGGAGDGEQGDEPGAVTDLEERLDVLEAKVGGLMRDPMDRAYAFLNSESAELRRQGIELLERFARFDPEAREAIRAKLLDPSADVREEALEAIEEIGDLEALPQVRSLLADASTEVREEAIDTLRDLLRDAEPDSLEARLAADALALRLQDLDAGVREEALEALADLSVSSEVVLTSLTDSDPEVREEAIQALGRLGDPSAIPHLRDVYATATGEHRLDAAIAMARLGDRQAFEREAPRLIEQASSHLSERQRSRALWILAEVDRNAYREVLDQALQDPSERVRRTARRVLRRRR